MAAQRALHAGSLYKLFRMENRLYEVEKKAVQLRGYNSQMPITHGCSRRGCVDLGSRIKRNQGGCCSDRAALLCNPEVASMNDRIEKRIELKAPISRVWRALTDYREFGEWFRVKLDGPFVPGQVSRGQITYPGYEHVKWEAVVQKMEHERLFSFTWHPYAVDPKIDYSKETPTLVEFRLEKTTSGTLLVLTESGFDKVPSDRRAEAFRMNDGGWTEQMKNIEKHVAQES